jgi:hypothetical protein
VDRLRTLGVLLIVTHRPEFEPPWIGRPYVAALTLNRLGEREIEALIDRVTGTNSLSESVRHDIIERAFYEYHFLCVSVLRRSKIFCVKIHSRFDTETIKISL